MSGADRQRRLRQRRAQAGVVNRGLWIPRNVEIPELENLLRWLGENHDCNFVPAYRDGRGRIRIVK